MDRHLAADNRRNGYGRKTALTGYGQIDPDVPLGRQSRFGPQLPPSCRRRMPDFDDEVISMQVRDIIVREIPEHFRDLCKLGVLSGAEAVPDEVVARQVRPLKPIHPLAFFGALRVEIGEVGAAGDNTAPPSAPGVRPRACDAAWPAHRHSFAPAGSLRPIAGRGRSARTARPTRSSLRAR
jgi:putative transposase